MRAIRALVIKRELYRCSISEWFETDWLRGQLFINSKSFRLKRYFYSLRVKMLDFLSISDFGCPVREFVACD